jgi:hypothetical protein
MWHGNAHLPNSGVVKEIIPNGFSHEGRVHDCLRLYTNFRTDGVADYMAYGVQPQINAGVQYTMSFYYRAVDSATVGTTGGISMHNTVGFGGGSFVFSADWKRYTAVVSSTGTGAASLYFNCGFGKVWDIAEFQCEEKIVPTSFVDGIRQRSNLQYPSFVINTTNYTISCWVKFNSIAPNGSHQTIIEVDEAPGGTTYRFLMAIEANKFLALNGGESSQSVVSTNIVPQANTWYHVTTTFDGTTLKCYIDGQLEGSVASVVPVFKEGALLGVGGSHWNSLNGVIDELRIDKVARTGAEILAWYYQGRNGW